MEGCEKMSNVKKFLLPILVLFLITLNSFLFAANLESVGLFNKTSCFLTEDKGVRSFTCHGKQSGLKSPLALEKDIQISASIDHICAANKVQLKCSGVGLTLTENIAGIVKLDSSKNTVCYSTASEFKCLGTGILARAKLPITTKVVDFALGENHGCLIDRESKDKKTIHCFGNNKYSKADPPYNMAAPAQIIVGKNYSCALNKKSDYQNEVICWGKKSFNPPMLKQPLLIKGAKHFICAIDQVNFTDNKLICFGDNLPADIPDLNSANTLELGPYTGCSYDQKGKELICFGHNYQREIDISFEILTATPVKSLKVEDDLPNMDKEISRSSGGHHRCALFQSGRVKCWGKNYNGQLGYGDYNNRGDSSGEMGSSLKFLNLGPEKVISLALGGDHSCALFESGRVKCWGQNSYGQLGYGDTSQRGRAAGSMGASLKFIDLGGEKAISIFGGYEFNCALLSSGRSKCWGKNSYGQLGYGDTNNRGDRKSEMGANLKYLDLGPEKIKSMSLGAYYSCATFRSMRVKCWGKNGYGQLGYGDRMNRGGRPGEMGVKLLYIDLGPEKVISLKTGWYHACAIFESLRVKCWGANQKGELGLGDTSHRGGSPGQMGKSLKFSDLGVQKIRSLAIGGNQSCALFVTGRVKCWGSNQNGQLGLGDISNRGNTAGHMGKNLAFLELGPEKATSLSLGYYFSCATFESGRVKCWGTGSYGKLGYGNTVTKGDQAGEMGKTLKFIDLGPDKLISAF